MRANEFLIEEQLQSMEHEVGDSWQLGTEMEAPVLGHRRPPIETRSRLRCGLGKHIMTGVRRFIKQLTRFALLMTTEDDGEAWNIMP